MKKQRLVISAVLFWYVMAVSGAAWCGDNGDGTVTVNGLVWLKDAGCLGSMNWGDAMKKPKTLAHGQCGLTDNSKPGNWRLPKLHEFENIYSVKSQLKNVQPSYYWSSSFLVVNGTQAWTMGIINGIDYLANKNDFFFVLPVRY